MIEKEKMLNFFEKGLKKEESIGMEVEHFILDNSGHSVPFDTQNGIEAILKELNNIFDGSAIIENGKVVGLESTCFNITIEPGGQLEISIDPQNTIHELDRIYYDFAESLYRILVEKNLYALSIGYHPIQANEEIPWMPKKRYQIMSEYFLNKGHLAHHMMKSTTSTQVAIDYKDDDDFSQKYSICNRLSVFGAIIFDNAPFYEGILNPHNLTRIQCWMNCDDDRCGMMEKAFKNGYTFNDYIDYILDVPMIVQKSGDHIIDAGGLSYRNYLKQNSFDLTSFKNHLTMVFPDIRVKDFIEIRTADGLPINMVMSVPAFWIGILYDKYNLNELLAVTKEWKYGELIRLRDRYIQDKSLELQLHGKTIYEWIMYLLELSSKGLQRRSVLLDLREDENIYLEPLINIWNNRLAPKDYIKNQFSESKISITQFLKCFEGGYLVEDKRICKR